MDTTALFSRTVLRSGLSNDRSVALAHGMGGSIAAHFGPIIEELAAKRTIIGADYPGSGETPRAKAPLSLDQLADGIVAAAVAEGVETFALIGFSMGGAVAIRAAVRHPQRVSALVLTSAFDHLDSYMRLSADVSGTLLAQDPAVFGKVGMLLSLSPAAICAMPPAMLDQVVASATAGLAPGTPEHAELYARIDVRDDLAKIAAPTLVVASTEDRVVPVALQRAMAAAIPNARLIEIETGHLVFMEQPRQWLSIVETFLDDVTA